MSTCAIVTPGLLQPASLMANPQAWGTRGSREDPVTPGPGLMEGTEPASPGQTSRSSCEPHCCLGWSGTARPSPSLGEKEAHSTWKRGLYHPSSFSWEGVGGGRGHDTSSLRGHGKATGVIRPRCSPKNQALLPKPASGGGPSPPRVLGPQAARTVRPSRHVRERGPGVPGAWLTFTATALDEEADEVQQGQLPVLLVRLDPLLDSRLQRQQRR